MNDKDDIIIKTYRKRLKDFEQPVEKDIWASIERDLQATTPKQSRVCWMWTGIAASVLIAIVSGLFLLPKGDTQIPVLAKKEQQGIITKETATIQKAEKKQIIGKTLFADNKKIAKKSSLPLIKETVKDPSSECSGTSNPEESPSAVPAKQQESQKGKAKNKDKSLSINTLTDQDTDSYPSSTKKKKKRNMSYGLSIGNSGSLPENYISSEYAGFESAYPIPSIDKVIGNPLYNDIGIANGNEKGNTTYDYTPPVSVGFSIRKHFSDHWALESGLSYSYLSSRETTSYINRGLQENDIVLHYVGIPVKGIFSFYNTNRVSIYVAAGGMVEKSVFGQKKTTINNHSSTKKLDIPELQWSISGNVGINYRLAGHFGLFVETGLSYYWDDHSDVMTIRKDSPTNMNIQGGIRLTY